MQRQRSKTVPSWVDKGRFILLTFSANYNSDIRLHYSDYSNNIMALTQLTACFRQNVFNIAASIKSVLM